LRYRTGPWVFTGVYYWAQNSYLNAKIESCQIATTATPRRRLTAASEADRIEQLRQLNQGSFLIDYTFNKHFDIYAGVTPSDIGGGLSSSFLQTGEVAVTSGFRVKF